MQWQVAKLGSELFYYWPLLRNNKMATNFRRCPVQVTVVSVANLAVFPRIWACFFVDLRFFLRLACCLFLSLF